MDDYLDDEPDSMANMPPGVYMRCHEYMSCSSPREEAPTESKFFESGTTDLDEQICTRSNNLDTQLEAARLELETLQTAVHEGARGRGSRADEGWPHTSRSPGRGGRKRALGASRNREASSHPSHGYCGSSLREEAPPYEDGGDGWSGLSSHSPRAGQGAEGLAWPFVKGPSTSMRRSEASMSASAGEGRAVTPSLFTLSSSLPEVYSTSAYLRDSEVHEGEATTASESPATEAEGREAQSASDSEGMGDRGHPTRGAKTEVERVSGEGPIRGTSHARGAGEGLRSPSGGVRLSGRGLGQSSGSIPRPAQLPGLRSNGGVVSPLNHRRLEERVPDLRQPEVERLLEDNQRLRRQLDAQASWIVRHKEELGRLRRAEEESKQREANLIAHNARLETQVSDLRTDASRFMTHQQELMAQVEGRGEELAAVNEELAQQTARAERAEAKAARCLREQEDVARAERRAEKEATLQKLAHFQHQLDAAVQQFKGARSQIDRLNSTNQKLKEELKGAHNMVARHEEELHRRQQAIHKLSRENRGLAGQYEVLLQQHGDDVAALQSLKATCTELEEALKAAELELERETDHRRQCASLLEVVEEQQGMIVELKEKQQTLQSEVQRLLVQEADWRARARHWQRERAISEREQRHLKHQLERAFRS